MTNYTVCDGDGYAITAGLQESEAKRVAQSIANARSEAVYLSDDDDADDDLGEEYSPEYLAADLVLCRSDAGDGGWSLHPPGSTDEQIAGGDALLLRSGEAECDAEGGEWSAPDAEDYRLALVELAHTPTWKWQRA